MPLDHYIIDCLASDEGEACVLVCNCGYHAVAQSWADVGRRVDVHLSSLPSFARVTSAPRKLP